MDLVKICTIVLVMYIMICTYLLINVVTSGNSKSLIVLIHDCTDLLISKCHSLNPSNSTFNNFIKGVNHVLDEFCKIILCHPKGDEVKSNIERFKNDSARLEAMTTTGRKFNANARLANHIKDMSNDAETLGEHLEKFFPEGAAVCALSIQIGKHAPIVAIAFAALIPVLQALEANNELVETIKESSTRLKKLTEKICNLLSKVKRERSRFGVSNVLEDGEMKELDTYFFALEDGYSVLEGILQDRKQGIWSSFKKLRFHKERLNSWNKAVDEMLKENQQHRIDMVYYRSLMLLKLEWTQISLQFLQIAIMMIGFATVIKKIEDLDRIGKLINFLKNKYGESLELFHNCIKCAGSVFRRIIDGVPVKEILNNIKATLGKFDSKEVIQQIKIKSLDGKFLIQVAREFCNKIKIGHLRTVASDFMAFLNTIKFDKTVLHDIKIWVQEHEEEVIQSLSGVHGVCNQASVSC